MATKNPEIARAKRVKTVFTEIEKATKSGSRITTRDLHYKTGFSEELVLSTIHLVNRTMDRGYYGAAKMIDYRPANGWAIGRSWEDRARWAIILHKHIATRCEHLIEEADVAEALWPGKAPTGLSAAYRTALRALDKAGGMIDSLHGVKGKVAKVKAVRRPKLVR